MLRFILKNKYLLAAALVIGLYLIHFRLTKIKVINNTGTNTGTNIGTNTGTNTGDPEENIDPDIDPDDYDFPITTIKDSQVLFVTENISEVGQAVSGNKIYPVGTVVELIDTFDPNWWKVRTPDGLRGFMFSGYLNK